MLNTSQSGLKSGLELDMYVNISNKTDFNRLRIDIHNQSFNPISMLKKMKISSGSKNYFEVNRVFDKKLTLPFNDCYEDISLFKGNRYLIDYINSQNRTYFQYDCRRLFINLRYKETSNCSCNYTKLDTIEEDCNYKLSIADETNQLSRCTINEMNKISENIKKQGFHDYCPLECNSIAYQISSYIVDYPNVGPINDLEFKSSFKTYEEMKRHYFGLRIYYQDTKYTLIEQQPKIQLADLISNIGGILGLFIGVSFLSFIEIVEILSEILMIYFELQHRMSQ